MARKSTAPKIQLSPSERETLEGLIRRRKTGRGIAQRAQILPNWLGVYPTEKRIAVRPDRPHPARRFLQEALQQIPAATIHRVHYDPQFGAAYLLEIDNLLHRRHMGRARVIHFDDAALYTVVETDEADW